MKVCQRQLEFWNWAKRISGGITRLDGLDSGANGELLLAFYPLDGLRLPVLRPWVFITVFALNTVTQLLLIAGQRGMGPAFAGCFKQAKSGGADQGA